MCAGVGDTVAGVDVAGEDVVAGGCCKWGLLIKASVKDLDVMLLQDGVEICTGVGGAVGAGGDCCPGGGGVDQPSVEVLLSAQSFGSHKRPQPHGLGF